MTDLSTPSPNPAHDTGELPGLTVDERKLLAKMFSDPLSIPPEWKAWIVSYLEANPPALTVGDLFGPSGSPFGTGFIVQYGSDTPPAGWLLCDGSSVPRTTYPDLFGVIGTLYGSVDGTHFNVPDLRGRSPVGKGSNATVSSLGNSDGVTEANRRGTKHRHTPHTHTWTGLSNVAGGSDPQAGGHQFGTTNTGSADGGSGNANDPLDGGAFLVVNFIIKT